MRSTARRPALVALCALAVMLPSPAAGAAVPSHAEHELAVAAAIDTARRGHRLRPLVVDDRLGVAAQRHAAAMVRAGVFSHAGADGARLVDRVRAAGYLDGARSWWLGEALAWHSGNQTAGQVVDAWLASPPHRRLLLDPGARDVGVGMVPGLPRPAGAVADGATWAVELGAVRRHGAGHRRASALRRRHGSLVERSSRRVG